MNNKQRWPWFNSRTIVQANNNGHRGQEVLVTSHLMMQWEWCRWEHVVQAASDPMRRCSEQTGQNKSSSEPRLWSTLVFCKHGIGGLQACSTRSKGYLNESQEVASSSSTWIPVGSLNLMITPLSSSSVSHASEATMHTNKWSHSRGIFVSMETYYLK